MKKQSVARSLIYALRSGFELDKSLGVDFLNISLPEKIDLSMAVDHDPESEEDKKEIKQVSAAGIAMQSFAKTSQSAAGKAVESPSSLEKSYPVPAVNSISKGFPDISEVEPVEDKEKALLPIREEALACRKCRLCEERNKVVFGEGSLDADIVFVDEAPGYHEDTQGRPFVGNTGNFFTAMIEKGMQRPRSSVYTCNIVKCRPSLKRDPEESEILSCAPYLQQQLTIIRPKLIITLGRFAAQIMTGEKISMRSLRGNFYTFRGIPLLPIYHPAYLLSVRQKEGGKTREDRETWQDLQKAIKFLQS